MKSILYLQQIKQMQDILHSHKTIKLDIAPRWQWENHHGYCGETAIQCCSLFYVRKIAGSQLLLNENHEQTLRKLGYDFETWDNTNKKQPQYKAYLQWIKKHLQEQSPVIIAGYEPEGQNQEYDHIFLAVGANSEQFNHYHDQDSLIYIDLFDDQYTVTQFQHISDIKGMKKTQKNISFAIPRDVDYGVAVTGVKDPEQMFQEIRIKIKQNSQPNVTQGEKPVMFDAQIIISNLEKGKKYILLRYNSYKDIPLKSVYEGKANKVVRFSAKGDQHRLEDSFWSNSSAFYRCIEEKYLE